MIFLIVLFCVSVVFFLLAMPKIIRQSYRYGALYFCISFAALGIVFICNRVLDQESPRYIKTIRVPLNNLELTTEGPVHGVYRITESDFVAKIAVYESNPPWYQVIKTKYELVAIERK